MISYQNSKKILSKAIIKIQDENIKSMNSLNRVLSENIYSKMNYPSGNNAAFDGYAINSKDTKQIKKRLPQAFQNYWFCCSWCQTI
jgi:molybdopterin molybdotransferase